MFRRGTAAIVAALGLELTLFGLEGESRADENPAPEPSGSVRLSAGPDIFFSNVCEEDGDVISCTPGIAQLMLGLRVLPLVTSSWAIGPYFGYGLEPGSGRAEVSSASAGVETVTRFSRRSFNVGLEVMRQKQLLRGFWYSATLGATLLQDVVREEKPTGAISSEAVSQWAACVGVGSGYDWWLGEQIALGLEARLKLRAFGDPDPNARVVIDYGTGADGYLGLNMGIGI